MMCGWQNQSNAAGWQTHIPSQAFARSNASRECSVIRKLGSSPWFAGEKNDLRHLRHGTTRLVRPKAEARSGFALRRSPYLPRLGGASRRLPAVWCGEARASWTSWSRMRCTRSDLPCTWAGAAEAARSGTSPRSCTWIGRRSSGWRWTTCANRSGVQEPRGRSSLESTRSRSARGHTYRIVGQRSGTAPTDLVRWRRPERGEHGPVSTDFSAKRRPKTFVSPSWTCGGAFRIPTDANAPQAAILFDKFHVMKHLGEALGKIRKAEYVRLSGKQRQFIKGQKYTLLSHPQNLTGTVRKNLKLLLAANKRLNTALPAQGILRPTLGLQPRVLGTGSSSRTASEA